MRPHANKIAFLCTLLWASAATALTVDTPLPDAAQEGRAKALFHDIRCMVCQSEAIADSPSAVAADMRRVIREDIAAGQSEEDIKRNLAVRYGDAILMKPPLSQKTALLWFGPWLVLALGLGGVALYFRQAKKQ